MHMLYFSFTRYSSEETKPQNKYLIRNPQRLMSTQTDMFSNFYYAHLVQASKPVRRSKCKIRENKYIVTLPQIRILIPPLLTFQFDLLIY